MNRKILSDILSYVSFLESTGIRICLSSFHGRFQVFANQTFPYGYHLHPVCNYFRGSFGYYSPCSQNIPDLRQQALTAPTYRSCYAGVEEWVIPLLYRGERLAYVHIYGYRGQLASAKNRRTKLEAERGQELTCWYDQLSDQVPSREQVLAYVQPLQYMFEALYHACQQPQDAVSYGGRELYLRAMNYILQKYMNQLTVPILAGMLKCSESYLQQIFLRYHGQSVHQTIRQIRLQKAVQLLDATDLSITHIAVRCGFPDSNYFSSLFKKEYGLTPTQYRNRQKQAEKP